MKIAFLESVNAGEDVDISCFEKYGEVKYYRNTVKDNTAEHVGDAEVVIVNKAPMNEETLQNAADLKLICEFATGFDNVDLEYCKKRGIKVCNVTNYSTEAVAQHTFTMVLFLLEKISHYDRFVKSGEYGAQDRFSNFDVPFGELYDKTWGIIGMGHIGRSVARIAQGFGCHVIFYSVTGKSSCTEYERVEFDELLSRADFVSVHCPLSELTRDLIDKEALSKMKKSAILINVARGPVVNNKDLYEALMEGQIEAAGLDVLEKEPIRPDNPLGKITDSTKLLITPHMAWASREARQRLVNEVCLNIEAFLAGEDRNVVNP
ncbi:MAG: D-2-hydroxyacid dehydrogenase [Lachnospiraceae bacterium]|jgi:glycerate dehydrogenase|nr:D-2-hydroxyacid dehydrogenase [Lachnospiraceae bacterium]